MGCDTSPGSGWEVYDASQQWIEQNLAGTFRCQFHSEEWPSEFAITGTQFTGSSVRGNIAAVSRFSATSGVIFIQLQDAYNWDNSPRSGFTGVHFENLVPGQAFNGTEAFAETVDFLSLQQARNAMTPHTLDTFFANRTSRFERVVD